MASVADYPVSTMTDTATSPDAQILRPHRTVLLVDRDPALRALAARVLGTLDEDVIQASNGPAALRAAQTHPEGVDLLVTEIMMPLMDGFEIADRFRSLCPRAQVLMVTGDADNSEFIRRGLAKGNYSLLRKPFTSRELTGHVAELLDAPTIPEAMLTVDTSSAATSACARDLSWQSTPLPTQELVLTGAFNGQRPAALPS